ncbi:hypothetical protein BKA82DRAFT_32011 [Pisolithus tinctorius]|uniref:Uncharacterized protein n=1 Tax=Pisolithus tinctorius Marx 270 TaxID=870435 RepID=A0A0C3N9Q9_PISTI|nr:hypothetical protein BKA82DRAFT_32011 [Pisolithus tinctorius]KIN97809.1 hypothetical protein M404DRAFT_32011 [Pisolithus tinctorius Marx 270]
MSLVIAKRTEIEVAAQHDSMYQGRGWRKEFVRRVVEYMESLYVRECPGSYYAVPSSPAFFTMPQPLLAHVPPSLIDVTWDAFPTFPGLGTPFEYPPIHVSYHGYLTDFAPKLSPMSTPHAIANFNGCDLPSISYEDPALWTVPASTVTHNTFVYLYSNCHPLYVGGNPFRELIPPLRVWHEYLEGHFRGLWREGITDVEHVPLFFRERRRGGHLFDLQLLEFVEQFKARGDLDERRTGYDSAKKHLWWLDVTSRKRFTYWPGTDSIMADLEREMAKDPGLFGYKPRPRGLLATALARSHAAAETRRQLSSSQYHGRTVRIRRPVPRVS